MFRSSGSSPTVDQALRISYETAVQAVWPERGTDTVRTNVCFATPCTPQLHPPHLALQLEKQQNATNHTPRRCHYDCVPVLITHDNISSHFTTYPSDLPEYEGRPHYFNSGGLGRVRRRGNQNIDPEVLEAHGGAGAYPLHHVPLAENGNMVESNEIAKRHFVCGDPRGVSAELDVALATPCFFYWSCILLRLCWRVEASHGIVCFLKSTRTI